MIVIFYYYPSAAGERLMLELTERTLCGMNERGKRRAKEEKRPRKAPPTSRGQPEAIYEKIVGCARHIVTPGGPFRILNLLLNSFMTKISNFCAFCKFDLWRWFENQGRNTGASDNKSGFLAGKLAFSLDWCRHTSSSGSFGQTNLKVWEVD